MAVGRAYPSAGDHWERRCLSPRVHMVLRRSGAPRAAAASSDSILPPGGGNTAPDWQIIGDLAKSFRQCHESGQCQHSRHVQNCAKTGFTSCKKVEPMLAVPLRCPSENWPVNPLTPKGCERRCEGGAAS